MPKVLNKRTDVIPADAVYVGRPTKFGNPFKIQKDFPRDVCVAFYAGWMAQDEQSELRKAVREELAGKDLVCWCAPERCHADILLSIANDTSQKEG